MLKPEIRKFRLAVSVSTPDGGVSLMRGLGPLNAMRREDDRLEIVLPRLEDGRWKLSWDWLGGCDALLLVAPNSAAHCQLAVKAKMMGLPVWVDWDDDLTCLPKYNPAADMFPPDAMRLNLPMLTRCADVVTVSTGEIQRRRAAAVKPDEAKKIRVLPNASHWENFTGDRSKLITWRGWGNHDADIMDVLPAIAEVSKLPQFCNWKWFFMGEPGWRVMEALPPSEGKVTTPYEYDPGFDKDPFLYMRALASLNPWLHIVPLQDNPFNRCRSNLAWIEATAAGALVLAPDWEEWQRPGVTTYTDADDFKVKLRQLIEAYKAHGVAGKVQESQEYIAKFLTLKALNQQRWEIINSFTK
jgi:hypothetical protein